MNASRRALVAISVLCCSLLAACGGGGGGSSPVVTSTTTPAGGATLAVIRSDAQTVLTVAKLLGSDGYYPGGTPLGAMSVARLIRSRKHLAVANCSSGGSSGVGSVSFDESTDAQGNDTQNYRDYYDASCAQPERVATLIYPPGTSVGSPSGSITGSTTEYARAGTVSGYASVAVSWTPSSVTVRTADAASAGGPVVGQSGATCTATSSTMVTCTTASFQTVAGSATGLTATVTESVTSLPQGGGGTVSAQLSATTYSGSGLALVAPASGTAWTLNGGTPMDTLAGNGTATFSGSAVTSGNYSVTDTTQNVTASGSFSSAGPLTVTLTQTGATLATIVIDVDGNGTVTYAGGTVQAVAGFVIFG